jgi:TM2 domain-containing membrane protein YozV
MDAYQNPFMAFPGITPEEMGFLTQGTAELSENQKKYFYMAYTSKRKSSQDVLIYCIIGLCLVPGFQRFMTGQIGMGFLYFFTVGLCFIGSIVDLVNYKSFTDDYNRKMAFESLQMARMSSQD